MITNAELTEMKERAKKATAGPWVTYYESLVKSKEGDKVVADTWQVVNGEYDARFIAHAREDVPRLVSEVEHLRNALQESYLLVSEITGWCSPINEALRIIEEALGYE